MGVRHLLRHPLLTTMTDRSEFVFTSEMVPQRYDELLVPALFRPWAVALVATLAPKQGGRVLDVATGPGTVARVLAKALGPHAQVAACDSSPTMIARAEGKGEVKGGAPIAYTVAPAAPLPYPDGSFDGVTCQQGLQFFPDALLALAEMRRVMTRKGKLVASVWCPPERCRVFHAFIEALRATGCDELAQLMTIPFPRWTDRELADRARTAGFRTASVTAETRDLEFPGGVRQALEAFTGTPIGPLLEALDAERRAAIGAAAERTFAPLLVGGAVRGPMTSWILVASA